LQNELKKIGAELVADSKGVFFLKSNFKMPSEKVETYNDHRMAMSFAPLALKGELEIVNPSVVIKSYPAFWDQLNAAHFEIKSGKKIL
jgi:3-phosphoshikimate 1-carboxyvinyltransferase